MENQGFIKKIKAKRHFTLVLSVIISIAIVFTFESIFSEKNVLQNDNVIRLHIIANSDNDEDQYVKLKVRDAILEKAKYIFDGEDIENAKDILISENDKIIEIANTVLYENGFDYKAVTEYGIEEYPDREYDGEIYPAGKYISYRVILGDGEGQNWWCVLFPPLCLKTSIYVKKTTDITATEIKIPKIKLGFKLINLFK